VLRKNRTGLSELPAQHHSLRIHVIGQASDTLGMTSGSGMGRTGKNHWNSFKSSACSRWTDEEVEVARKHKHKNGESDLGVDVNRISVQENTSIDILSFLVDSQLIKMHNNITKGLNLFVFMNTRSQK
jgi:hypothetical protein